MGDNIYSTVKVVEAHTVRIEEGMGGRGREDEQE